MSAIPETLATILRNDVKVIRDTDALVSCAKALGRAESSPNYMDPVTRLTAMGLKRKLNAHIARLDNAANDIEAFLDSAGGDEP
jgi:hypothetical protein